MKQQITSKKMDWPKMKVSRTTCHTHTHVYSQQALDYLPHTHTRLQSTGFRERLIPRLCRGVWVKCFILVWQILGKLPVNFSANSSSSFLPQVVWPRFSRLSGPEEFTPTFHAQSCTLFHAKLAGETKTERHTGGERVRACHCMCACACPHACMT